MIDLFALLLAALYERVRAKGQVGGCFTRDQFIQEAMAIDASLLEELTRWRAPPVNVSWARHLAAELTDWENL